MVLIRALALLVLAGCNQSLFSNGENGGGDGGNNNGDGSNGTDGPVPTSCPTPCVADAGGDFDGSAGGSNGRWRYLDDHKNRSWQPMTAGATGFTGANAANRIASCAANSSASGCAALPGALLLSSAGNSATEDPAIELTIPSPNQVVQVTLRVHSPVNQAVRLYRSAREDVLFTGVAMANTTLETTLTVDALAGDRLLFALTPGASGASDVAVQLFVSETGDTFPKHCQLALTFDQASGNTVPDACGAAATHFDFTSGDPSPPSLVPGPFPELRTAVDIPTNRYVRGAEVLQRPGDFTVQFWVQSDAVSSINAYGNWAFSDLDYDAGGGLGFVIYDDTNTKAEIETIRGLPNDVLFMNAPYPMDHAWHFVRIAYTNGTASMCLDGSKRTGFDVAAGALQSSYRPHIGRNVVWLPVVAEMDGKVDDVRVFDVALPCE